MTEEQKEAIEHFQGKEIEFTIDGDMKEMFKALGINPVEDTFQKNAVRINSLLQLIQEQQKELEIVDKYAQNLWQILSDYDGYYDEETKQGSLEGLAGLVDEAMDTCKKIIRRDTKSVIYTGGNNKKYNILMEEIKGDDE